MLAANWLRFFSENAPILYCLRGYYEFLPLKVESGLRRPLNS
uniref:Uncharacterized protein n=1 Tax=Arundo donax TaxID=35708 RepID=A0A0A9C337_ARUDO